MSRKTILIICNLSLLATSRLFSQAIWQRYWDNPVLSPQADWEAGGNINNTVVKIDNLYQHWFTGIGSRFRIGMATSTDGVHWQKSNANPVLNIGAPGEFDSEHVYNPMVVYYDGLYWMWYAGNNGTSWQIGLATSKDGIEWKKHSNNPVFKIGNPGQWDDKHITSPFVMRDGVVFKMWYRGESATLPGKGSTGYAESPDGVHWERYSGNPVFAPAPSGWDSRSLTIYPVIKRDGKYEGWYAGSDGSISQLGYATSPDGIHWQRYPNNPVLSPTHSNSWDSEQVSSPFVLFEKMTYQMWYSGYGSSGWRIGYATSPATPTPKRFVYLPREYGLPGDTINVAFYTDTVTAISGGDVTIKFDDSVLKCFKVQTTKFTRDFLIAANLDTPGVVRVSLASVKSATGGLGALFNLRMVANSALSTPPNPLSYPLTLSHVALYTENGKTIPFSKRNGEFILGRSRGDVNRDGHVNSADAILTLRIAAGLFQPTPTQFADADVDGNGKVESIDATSILFRAVGLDSPPNGGISNTPAYLSFSPFSISTGEQVETRLGISGISQLLGGDVSLRFDANALEIVDILPSPEISEIAFVNNLTNSGHVNFSFAATNSFSARSIAVVRLRAKAQINETQLRAAGTTFFDEQNRSWNGVLTAIAEPSLAELPAVFSLEQNYPNPFYRQPAIASAAGLTNTQIRYTLPQHAYVKLMVYDLSGRLVWLLESAENAAGAYLKTWDGRNELGLPVASGVYLYRLQVGQMTLTKKMLIVD